MEKIVLIPQNPDGLSKRTARLATIFLGITFMAQGIIQSVDGISAFGIIMFIAGIIAFWSAFIVLSPKSRWALKAVINDEYISFKTSLFSRPPRYVWQEIDKIELKSYEIELLLKSGETKSINYKTYAESSLELKEAIRERGAKYNIPVLP